MGEGLQYPPWLIARELTIPQKFGLWGAEKPVKELNAEEAAARWLKIRKRRGLPAPEERPATHECVDGRWVPIAKEGG